MRGKSEQELIKEYNSLNKDWLTIYGKWKSLTRPTYMEIIAKFLCEGFESIELDSSHLREKNFKQKDHRGQLQLNTPIAQITEKRFCRALFNKGKLDNLGKVLDYEIPLQRPEMPARNHTLGEIDLISQNDNGLMIIEAKNHSSTESILKAILEAYFYSNLVQKVKTQFFKEYELDDNIKISPVVLTFLTATSGRNIESIAKNKLYPIFRKLLTKLNYSLSKNDIKKIRFFIIKPEVDINGCLKQENDERILFKENFKFKIEEVTVLYN